MAYSEHQPVLLHEVVCHLDPRPGRQYVDGTVGGAGHAEAILQSSSPDGWLYGCDLDGEAVQAAAVRLARYAGRFELRQGNFADLPSWVRAGGCAGVLLDLGVSAHQLECGERGFSLYEEGPLDMRLDNRSGPTAADLVNEASAEELADMFWKYGGERQARRIARAIVERRRGAPWRTTRELSDLVSVLVPRRGARVHPATRVFQSLRIAVNDELGSLRRGLEAVWSLLEAGGRLAVITFHSGEDRLVKEFGRSLERDYEVPGGVDVPALRCPRPARLRWVERKAIQPAAAEVARNPRARSAQLRVMEKLGN